MQEILRSDMKAVGVPDQLLRFFTNHGLRTGGAQDFFNSLADPKVIIMVGRWKSSACPDYLKVSPESAPLPLVLSNIALTSEPSVHGKRLASDSTNDINRFFAGLPAARNSLVASPLLVSPIDPFPPVTGIVQTDICQTGITAIASFTFKPKTGSSYSLVKRPRTSPPLVILLIHHS